MQEAIRCVESVKGEPSVPALKGTCDDCPYEGCAYNGLSEPELPAWLRRVRG